MTAAETRYIADAAAFTAEINACKVLDDILDLDDRANTLNDTYYDFPKGCPKLREAYMTMNTAFGKKACELLDDDPTTQAIRRGAIIVG